MFKIFIGLILIAAILVIYRIESYEDRDKSRSRRRPRGYPGVNLLGTWRGYGSLLGFYTVKYIDYGEYEAIETSSGRVLTLRPAGQADIFIEDRAGVTLKGSMRRNSQDEVYEIVGVDLKSNTGYTLTKE